MSVGVRRRIFPLRGAYSLFLAVRTSAVGSRNRMPQAGADPFPHEAKGQVWLACCKGGNTPSSLITVSPRDARWRPRKYELGAGASERWHAEPLFPTLLQLTTRMVSPCGEDWYGRCGGSLRSQGGSMPSTRSHVGHHPGPRAQGGRSLGGQRMETSPRVPSSRFTVRILRERASVLACGAAHCTGRPDER